jgi:putative oxidoreductase
VLRPRSPIGVTPEGVASAVTGYVLAMLGPRSLTRALMAAPFILGGLAALRAPDEVAPAAETVGVPIAEQVGVSAESVTLVKFNAGVQVGAGALLLLGVLPRVASLALAASLVPTSLAGHRFWEKSGEERKQQMIHFAKNAGLLGGLLAHALDTGGRPSVFWSGRHAAEQATASIADAAQSVAETVSETVSHAYHALPGVS